MARPLPPGFLASLEGLPGFSRAAMEDVHAAGTQVTSIRLNPAKPITEEQEAASFYGREGAGFFAKAPVPWAGVGCYLSQRPSFTFDPFFHAGCYYVQEASSMFLEQALRQLADLSQPMRVLDLCAAPGGKSTHLQSLLHPDSLLVSNEVIRARTSILIDNILKWGAQNVFVTNNDPSVFAKLGGWFDVLVVDAPCSGSGLFRRDADAMDEWSLNNVDLCSQRQKRILADALPSLKENGLLIYSTCSYSREEDEWISDWLVNEHHLERLLLRINGEWGIVETEGGYRFYPDKIQGEGFFLAAFRKTTYSPEERLRPSRPVPATAKEKAIIQPWLNRDTSLLRINDTLFALPPHLVDDYAVLEPVLRLLYTGVEAGRIMKDKLVPGHALALSTLLTDGVPVAGLDYADSIRYLQRNELATTPAGKGWQRVRYAGHDLGWINGLGNRVNNYYPKELRILKQSNGAGFEK